MKRIIGASFLIWPALANAQADVKSQQFADQIFPLVEQSAVIGRGHACGLVSDKFSLQASTQLMGQALTIARNIWGPNVDPLPAQGAEAWNYGVNELKAAYDSSKGSTAAECQQFQASGGAQALAQAFPNIAN